MFLKPTAKPDAAAHVAPLGGAAGAAGQADRVGRRLVRPGSGRLGAGADDLGHRGGAGDDLAGDELVARRQGVAQPQLDRVDAERGGQLVHLGLVAEAGLHRAEARAWRRTAGCWCAAPSRR